MAQHGGTAYLADAHSPTTPATATLVGPGSQPAAPGPRPTLAPLPQSSSRRRPPPPPPDGVTLEAPRLDGDRVTNEYVETPFRASEHQQHQQHQQHHHQQQSHVPTGARRVPSIGAHEGPRRAPGVARRAVAPETLRPSLLGKQQHHSPSSPPVTKQPTAASPPLLPAAAAAATFTKGGPRAAGRGGAPAPECAVARDGGGGVPSIICPACSRCRCASCRSPRPLPSAWLCRDSCFCSAETTVDYASCLCCVKGLFYHCGGKEGYEGGSGATSCADDPCSCAPPRRCLRWACLCALTAALPCLLCYWPLRGAAGAVERCYGRYAVHGCRCQPRADVGGGGGPLGSRGAGGDLTPEKRLLASSPDF